MQLTLTIPDIITPDQPFDVAIHSDTGGDVTLTLKVNGSARAFALEDEDPATSPVPVNKNKTVHYTIKKWGTAKTGDKVVVSAKLVAADTSSNEGAVGTA